MTTTEDRPADTITPDDLAVAAEAVITAQRATTSMVQRHVRAGWEKSGRILDGLVQVGVLARSGSGDPVVVAKREELDAILARLRATPPPAPASPTVLPPASPGVEMAKRPPAELATPRPTLARPDNARENREPPLLIARRRATQVVTTLGGTSLGAKTGRAGRRAIREMYVTGQGVTSWVARAHGGATHGHLREQIRLARLEGKRAEMRELIKDLREERNDRIDRLATLPRVVIGILATAAVAAGGLLVLLLLIGVVSFFSGGAPGWASWWAGVGAFIAAVVWAAGLVWQIGTWAAPPLLVLAAHREGKRAGNPPMWLLAPDERKLLGAEITPSKVVVALRDLGVPALRAALKDAMDAGAAMLGPIAVAGCGVQVDILLPSGVSTEEVQKRRRKLAENLGRHEYEVFIAIAAARTVRLWIADPGALDQPIGPSPLVVDTSLKVNVRTGKAPWGQNLRGDRVSISLWQRHLLITGLSNQGKTAAIRALALWLAFDVNVEFRIADLKGFRDWDMFQGLATVFIKGPADEHVIAATEMLEEGVEEMQRRLQAGRDDWPTLILLVDEAQQAYMCPAVGPDKRPYGGSKNTSRYFMAARKLHNQGRAVNVLLWQGTQDPTDQNLPKIVREGAHVRASLAVGTPEQAEMALGAKAVDGGAAPHLLRQGLDKGTVVVAGDGVDLPPGDASITIRTHFIDTEPATEVAKRAIERRRKAGKAAEIVEGATVVVDHLADIHAAMRGESRPRTVVVLGRLIEDNAAVYEPWGNDDLAAAVDAYAHLGLGIRKYGGNSVLRLEEVERALSMRE